MTVKTSGTGFVQLIIDAVLAFLLSVVLACCLWVFGAMGYAVRQSFGRWAVFFVNLIILAGMLTVTWYLFAVPTNHWFTGILVLFTLLTVLGVTDMDFSEGTLKLTNDTRAASVARYFVIGRLALGVLFLGVIGYSFYNPTFAMFAQ